MKPERRLPVTPLTLEVVRELAHAEAVQDEWTRFTASVPGITPFHLSAWQLTWWRHFGDGRLHIMLFRSLDTLVAIIPCYLTEQDGRPTLKLLGSGMASYLEPPIAAAQRADVVSLLKSHLLANKTWQMCDWRNVAPASPLAGLQLGDGFDVKIAPDSEWSQVPIQGTFQQYWEGRSFSLRRNFLKYLDNSSAFTDRPPARRARRRLCSCQGGRCRFPGGSGQSLRRGRSASHVWFALRQEAGRRRAGLRPSQHCLRVRGWARS